MIYALIYFIENFHQLCPLYNETAFEVFLKISIWLHFCRIVREWMSSCLEFAVKLRDGKGTNNLIKNPLINIYSITQKRNSSLDLSDILQPKLKKIEAHLKFWWKIWIHREKWKIVSRKQININFPERQREKNFFDFHLKRSQWHYK